MGLELIDYVALQKRGLIKKQQSAGKLPITKEGYIDLGAANKELVDNLSNSSNNQNSSNNSLVTSSSLTDNTSAMASTPTPSPGFTSFWDQLPGQTPSAPSSTETTSYYGSQSDTSSSLSNSGSSSSNYSDLASLKVKLDDLEYKLSRLTEKLDMISSRL